MGDRGAADVHLDDADANRRYWDGYAATYQRDHGAQLGGGWRWGTFSVPESEVGALGPVAALAGADVLELGCGAAQWSVALAAAGARVVGLDASAAQLAHARRTPAAVPLVQAVAEAVPLAAGSFDLVLSDHGAMSYVDPDRSLAEVARLLRPGGRLVFSQYTSLLALCWDDEHEGPDERLHRSWDELGRWADVTGFVSWDLSPGEWIRRFRAHGFTVEDLVELRPPPGSATTYHDDATIRWAERWPLEHLWIARRTP